MWKSAFCLFVALVLAIIGLSVDILMADIGTAAADNVWVNLFYGWNGMSWSISVDDYSTSNSATYQHSYSRYCNFTVYEPEEFCNDLKNVRDAGKVYIILNIIGIFIITVAAVISVFALFGRYLCSCSCRTKYVVAVLCAGGVVCFSIAFGFFLAQFSQETNKLIEKMTPYKLVDWNLAYIGPSIGLLIASTAVGFVTVICILWIDRDWDTNSNYQNLQDAPSSSSCCCLYKPEPVVQRRQEAAEGDAMTIPVPYYQEGQFNNNTTPV